MHSGIKTWKKHRASSRAATVNVEKEAMTTKRPGTRNQIKFFFCSTTDRLVKRPSSSYTIRNFGDKNRPQTKTRERSNNFLWLSAVTERRYFSNETTVEKMSRCHAATVFGVVHSSGILFRVVLSGMKSSVFLAKARRQWYQAQRKLTARYKQILTDKTRRSGYYWSSPRSHT